MSFLTKKFGILSPETFFATETLLSHIRTPRDLRKFSTAELLQVSEEIRRFIIDIISEKKGHLGSSLGVVELSVALHYVFDTPDDLLVWDVGHQAYPHKILTGRRDVFHTNRQLHGISGFPRREESVYDPFGVGHASTSISAVLGMAIASKLKGEKERHHIAVIGDASIAGGEAFEGLNHAGVSDTNLLVVLNDNEMGIDPNVGALKQYLTSVKDGRDPEKKNIFEALNFAYFGPVDGYDLPELIRTLKKLKKTDGPKFLHVITKKGKGLKKAEQDQVTYHAPGKFDKHTGVIHPSDQSGKPPKFQDVFGETLVELAQKNKKIIGITPAMPTGSSMKLMIDAFPERAFDVGIAEQHAVTLAAGMATQGMIPYCAIYSTFLQRAYDQLIHDVALQDLPVVFCIDRAGIVGEDGPTHHGVFDLAYLRIIPNMIVAAPMDAVELRNMLYTAQCDPKHPIAIRYPRGRGTILDWKKSFEKIPIGKGEILTEGEEIAVLSIGSIGQTVIEVIKEFKKGKVAHFNMRFVKPLDEELLEWIFQKYDTVITIEDGVEAGGFGSAVTEFAQKKRYQKRIHIVGVPDIFIPHGSVPELQEITGLSRSKIKDVISRALNN